MRRLLRTVEPVADVVLRGSGVLAALRAFDSRESRVLRVLAYHRVTDLGHDLTQGDPDVVSATPEAFAKQVRFLARHYTPIGVAELEASLIEARPLPPRAVMVTFDDGYRDFLAHAWPILKEYGVPVVLFVPTAYPDGERSFWWDELWQVLSKSTARTAPHLLRKEMRFLRPDVIEQRMAELRVALDSALDVRSLVLGWHELRTLAREGVVVASHGRSHASMPSLNDMEIVEEIEGSQADLERELGSAPRIFAFPFGHYDERAAAVMRARGFIAAFGTVRGRNVFPVSHPYSMLRQSVNPSHSLSRMQLGLSGFLPRPLVDPLG